MNTFDCHTWKSFWALWQGIKKSLKWIIEQRIMCSKVFVIYNLYVDLIEYIFKMINLNPSIQFYTLLLIFWFGKRKVFLLSSGSWYYFLKCSFLFFLSLKIRNLELFNFCQSSKTNAAKLSGNKFSSSKMTVIKINFYWIKTLWKSKKLLLKWAKYLV